MTAAENIEIVLRFNGKRRAERAGKTRALLGELGIAYLADRFPRAMSQGEKQRVGIARAIANDAELLIADEPTGSLETRKAIDIISLLHGQARTRNATVIVASHDLRLREFADRTLRLQDGMIG